MAIMEVLATLEILATMKVLATTEVLSIMVSLPLPGALVLGDHLCGQTDHLGCLGQSTTLGPLTLTLGLPQCLGHFCLPGFGHPSSWSLVTLATWTTDHCGHVHQSLWPLVLGHSHVFVNPMELATMVSLTSSLTNSDQESPGPWPLWTS